MVPGVRVVKLDVQGDDQVILPLRPLAVEHGRPGFRTLLDVLEVLPVAVKLEDRAAVQRTDADLSAFRSRVVAVMLVFQRAGNELHRGVAL